MKDNTSKRKDYGYRWLVWGIMCTAYVIVFFHRVATGVVADNLMAEFGVTGAALGSLGAVYFYVYSVMQIPSGVLADTLGARITVAAGTMLAGTGSIVFGMAPNIGAAYIGRFLVGLGVSVVFVAILKVQSVWFKESEFGTLSGLTAFIGNGGALLAGTPLALAVSYFSWRTVFVIIGVISIVISVLNYIIVRNRPEDAGLPPVMPGGEKKEDTSSKPGILASIRTVVTNKHTWPGFVAFAGFAGAILSFTGMWGVPYMMAVYGLDKTGASSYITVAMAGLMVGSFLAGTVSDRMGSRKRPLLVFGVVNLMAWLLLIMWNSGKPPIGFLYPLLFLLGLSAAGFVITWAVGKEVNPPHIAGTAIGTLNIGGFLGPSILQPLMGYVLELNWAGHTVNGIRVYSQAAYTKALSLCAVAVMMAVVSIFFIKETNCRNIS